MEFPEINHPGGIVEIVLSERFNYVGVIYSRTGYPWCYYGETQRKYDLLLAQSGLNYSPKLRVAECPNGYLSLTNNEGERSIVTSDSVEDFMRALRELGALR